MIEIVINEDAEECDAVICSRVADLPPLESLLPGLREFALKVRERSSEEPCSICGEPIIVDITSPKKPPRICVQCCLEMEGPRH